MPNDNPDYLHLASHKFAITCKTCGVTETFYSEYSLGYFRLKHAGHEIVEGGRKAGTPTMQPPREAERPVELPVEQVKPVIKIERVVVDTKAYPVDAMPVIQVTGRRADGKHLFVRLFKPEEAGKMREFLRSGRYEDGDAGSLVYAWDPGAVSFADEEAEKSTTVEPEEKDALVRRLVPLLEPVAPVETEKKEAQIRRLVPPVDAVDSVFPSMETPSRDSPPELKIFPEPTREPVPERAQIPAASRSEKPKRASLGKQIAGYLRPKHSGFDIDDDEVDEARPSEEAPDATKPGVFPATEDKPTFKIDRVLVDTRVSPVDGFPVIRVRGMRVDGTLDFVRLFKPEEAGKMREFLGSGRYEDLDAADAGNVVYTWEADAISFLREPAEKAPKAEPGTEEVRAQSPVPAVAPVDLVDSVFPSLETPSPEPPRALEKAAEPEREPTPEPPEVLAEVPEPVRGPVPDRAKQPAPKQKRKRKPATEAPAEEKQVAKPALAIQQAVASPEKPKKNHETLLLAKSSYIQEGEETMSEALRISKILKAFRWNVEPVYTIGVIVDDNLSIETNKGEISGALVKQIENAGYKLSAVTASSTKPTAWFKRKPSQEVPIVDDPERTRQLEQRVVELTKKLHEERSGADEQKAEWERRFLLLTNLVRSLRQGGPGQGAEDGDSEPQPEADVTS